MVALRVPTPRAIISAAALFRIRRLVSRREREAGAWKSVGSRHVGANTAHWYSAGALVLGSHGYGAQSNATTLQLKPIPLRGVLVGGWWVKNIMALALLSPKWYIIMALWHC